jgi:hypothetical protein
MAVLVITLMMETVSSFETSVSIYRTAGCNSPEDSHLHNRRRGNLKSHLYAGQLNNLNLWLVLLEMITPRKLRWFQWRAFVVSVLSVRIP